MSRTPCVGRRCWWPGAWVSAPPPALAWCWPPDTEEASFRFRFRWRRWWWLPPDSSWFCKEDKEIKWIESEFNFRRLYRFSMSTNVQSSLDGNPRFLCFLRHILKHLEWKIYQTDYKRAAVLPAVPVAVGEPHHDEQEHEEEEEGAGHSVDQRRGHRHRHRVGAGLRHRSVVTRVSSQWSRYYSPVSLKSRTDHSPVLLPHEVTTHKMLCAFLSSGASFISWVIFATTLISNLFDL